MSRLSTRDKRRADEVAAALRERGDRGSGSEDTTLSLLADLLAAPILAEYELAPTDEARASVDRIATKGVTRSDALVYDEVQGYFRRLGARRGVYDPLNPAPTQRNRPVGIPWRSWCAGDGPSEIAWCLRNSAKAFGLPSSRIGEAAETIWTCEVGLRKLGLPAHDQLRVLVCDDDTLLSWIGAFQPEPFTERQRLLLKRVTPALRDRVVAERRAADGSDLCALALATEHVPAAAFVLGAAADIIHANPVGRHRLERERRTIRSTLLRALQGAPEPGVSVTQVVERGTPPRFLVVVGAPGDTMRFALERARERWSLTPREVDVLAEIAAGLSNREIAARVRASCRTVELHVAALLRKAYADSRSQLVIDLWRLGDA